MPWAVLAVADSRGVRRCQAFGSQDGVPVSPSDVSPVFSVTTPIVAAAAAQLWERSLVNLHEPVSTYLPGFAANGKDGVLVRHLLTHLSCVSEAGPLEVMRRAGSVRELEQSVLDTPLDAPPGTRQRYSNAAFIALGMIVEKVSGAPLHAFLRRELFAPLAMESTGFDPREFTGRRVLSVPNMPDLGMSPTMEQFIHLQLAAAGLLSTAGDLIRFGQAFLNAGRAAGRRGVSILSPATCRAMMSPQTPGIPPIVPGDFDGSVMGLGWYVPSLPNHRLIATDGVVHSGAGGSQLFVSPRWGITIALATARIRLRTERILNAVLGSLAAD